MPARKSPSSAIFCASGILRKDSRLRPDSAISAFQCESELKLIHVDLALLCGAAFQQPDVGEIIRSSQVVDEFHDIVVGKGPPFQLHVIALHAQPDKPYLQRFQTLADIIQDTDRTRT